MLSADVCLYIAPEKATEWKHAELYEIDLPLFHVQMFNPVSFVFTAVDCRFPGEPRFGSTIADNGYQLGAEISFECNNGYRMEGSSWAVCTDTGKWEPPELPTCHGKWDIPCVL